MKSQRLRRLLKFAALLVLAILIPNVTDRVANIGDFLLTPRQNPWSRPGTQLFLAHLSTSGDVLSACTVRDPRVDMITRATDFMHILRATPGGDVLVGASNLHRAFLARFEAHSCRLRRDFGVDGVWEPTSPVGPFVHDVVVDERGNLVVAGSRNDSILVARLMADGIHLDPTFGGTGAVVTDLESFSKHANVVKIDRKGRLIVAGESDTNFLVARYLRSGELDRTFSGRGFFIHDFNGPYLEEARALEVLPDGKLLAVARNDPRLALLRLDPDGTLDSRFGGGGIVQSEFLEQDVAIDALADGHVLIAGLVYGPRGWDIGVSKYDAAGVLDHSFGANGMARIELPHFYPTVHVLKQLPDGRILIAASTSGHHASDHVLLARLTRDGQRDTSFGTDGVLMDPVKAFFDRILIVTAPDGHLVLSGTTSP